MPNDPIDWSGKSHHMLMECRTDKCQNKGRQWRVWLTKTQPGLLQVPTLICDECHDKVHVVEGCCDGEGFSS